MKRANLFAAAVCILVANVAAFETTTRMHLFLSGLRSSEAPSIHDGHVILSHKGPCRSVAVAFAHEHYTTIHPLEKNGYGVFVLAYPVPLEFRGPLEYRLVIDGVWTRDPRNPRARLDPGSGVFVSQADVPFISSERMGVYELVADDGMTARFLFKGEPDRTVTLTGDFAGWDPFLYEMSETSPGVYRLDLPLPSGTYVYAFIYKGTRVADPLNPDSLFTKEGERVSVLKVP